MNRNVGLSRFRLGWAVLGVAGLVLQAIATALTLPGYFTSLSNFVDFFSFFIGARA